MAISVVVRPQEIYTTKKEADKPQEYKAETIEPLGPDWIYIDLVDASDNPFLLPREQIQSIIFVDDKEDAV